MKRLTFDMIFKTVILLIAMAILYMLYCLLQVIKENSAIGRYQFNNSPDNSVPSVLDTKTGKVRDY